MNIDEKAMARKLFQLRVHKATGQAYEDLFVGIMTHIYKDFLPIEPYGNEGDRKNDGYIPSSGTYFQVYAPKDPTSNRTKKDAVNKAKADFLGLKAKWDQISSVRKYHFVFNDKFNGSVVPIEDALHQIRSDHALEEASPMLARHLEDLLFKLEDDIIFSQIGFLPNLEKIEHIDYKSLTEVLEHLCHNCSKPSYSTALNVPNYDEKILFNGLSKGPASLLTSASLYHSVLIDYFKRSSSFSKQLVRDELKGIYELSKKEMSKTSTQPAESVGDLVFFDVLHKMLPRRSDGRALSDAALVLMAYYFEACDIFEYPQVTKVEA